jgi:NAD(P)H-quinone oxidoreductase subunit 5
MSSEALVRAGLLLGLAGPLGMLALLGGFSLAGRPMREAATGYLARWIFLGSTLCFGGLLALSPGLSLPVEVSVGRWFGVGSYAFEVVLLADVLSLSFAFFAALLCGLVAAFSHRYLHREPGYQRFFLLLSLFGVGIQLIALAGSIEVAFAGWEFVGLSSALLVAFFHDRALPVKNGLITFVIYRISDIGIFWAAVLIHHYLATGRYLGFLGASWPRGTTSLEPGQATLVALFLVLAAIGKCAQLPFSSWLPRAMEGPTPSSAIFYGALSVHAGAFLLLRMGPVLDRAPAVAAVLVVIGLGTAIHAMLVGRVQTDIKSALAYATLTQVGIILAEIGLGFRWLPLMHMLGHAVLRSVQFLRAPSILHDFHNVESAVGGHMSRSGVHLERIFSRLFGDRMYRFALERNYVEAAMDRFVVHPLLGTFRRLDRLESAWVRRAGGKPRG